ncbi:MAG: esterase/lipase family protein [Granulosicoccus sp.]
MSIKKPRIHPRQDEVTVLVHGIWMQGFMMTAMSKRLESLGFRTVTFSYDFLNNSPTENACDLRRKIGELGARKVNLVGHSLGGIVILHLLDQFQDLAVGKVVLIGSPVKGSYVAKRVHENRVLRPLLGKSADGGLLDGAPLFRGDRPLGVITGSGRMGLLAVLYPAGDDSDGVVRDSETLIENAADRVCIPSSHSAMIFSNTCADYVANFLNLGRFRL